MMLGRSTSELNDLHATETSEPFAACFYIRWDLPKNLLDTDKDGSS